MQALCPCTVSWNHWSCKKILDDTKSFFSCICHGHQCGTVAPEYWWWLAVRGRKRTLSWIKKRWAMSVSKGQVIGHAGIVTGIISSTSCETLMLVVPVWSLFLKSLLLRLQQGYAYLQEQACMFTLHSKHSAFLFFFITILFHLSSEDKSGTKRENYNIWTLAWSN